MSAVDLSLLPPPDVVEVLDFETILAARKARLVSLYPAEQRDAIAAALELESEPMVKLLEEAAYDELILRSRVNDAARNVMVAYATGADLDHLGADVDVPRLAGETDARYRLRVQQGYSLLAAAGPANAYRAHALAASAQILDVGIDSPQDGRVVVAVLAYRTVAEAEATDDDLAIASRLFNGVTPPAGSVAVLAGADSDVLAAVRARLNAEDVRPLTDDVVVRPPDLHTYTVAAQLTVYAGPDSAVIRANALAALDSYLATIRRVGYDATRAGLIAALAVPGVQNVRLDAPTADIVVARDGLAVCTGVTVTLGGVDA